MALPDAPTLDLDPSIPSKPAAFAPVLDVSGTPVATNDLATGAEEEEEESELDLFVAQWKDKPVPAEILFQAIVKEAELEPADMLGIPMVDVVDTAGGFRYRCFENVPGRDDYVVVCAFVGAQADRLEDHVAGDVRIFAAPRSAKTGDLLNPFYCYTVSRVPGAGLDRTIMPLKLFVEEAGYELNRLAVEFDVLDDDSPDDDDDDEPEE